SSLEGIDKGRTSWAHSCAMKHIQTPRSCSCGRVQSVSFSLREKVARQRRMRPNPPHDFVDVRNRGAGYPHPALPRHPLPEGEGFHLKHGPACNSGFIDPPRKKVAILPDEFECTQ